MPLIDHFEDEQPCLILKARYTYYGCTYPRGYTNYGLLAVAILAVAILTMAILAVAILTMAILTMAILL